MDNLISISEKQAEYIRKANCRWNGKIRLRSDTMWENIY